VLSSAPLDPSDDESVVADTELAPDDPSSTVVVCVVVTVPAVVAVADVPLDSALADAPSDDPSSSPPQPTAAMPTNAAMQPAIFVMLTPIASVRGALGRRRARRLAEKSTRRPSHPRPRGRERDARARPRLQRFLDCARLDLVVVPRPVTIPPHAGSISFLAAVNCKGAHTWSARMATPVRQRPVVDERRP